MLINDVCSNFDIASKTVDELLASTPEQQLTGMVPLRPTRASRKSGRRKSLTSIWSSISKKFSSSSSTPGAKNHEYPEFNYPDQVNE